MKKRSEETQTLHAGCSKAEPKFFTPPQTPFPVARDDQNLISWRWSLPLPTNPVWRGSMHAISSYHGKRPTSAGDGTHKHTRSPTHKQDQLQYTAPQLAHSVTTHSKTIPAEPGLVAFYDIRPRNGVGLFLQPWNPHGAVVTTHRNLYHNVIHNAVQHTHTHTHMEMIT